MVWLMPKALIFSWRLPGAAIVTAIPRILTGRSAALRSQSQAQPQLIEIKLSRATAPPSRVILQHQSSETSSYRMQNIPTPYILPLKCWCWSVIHIPHSCAGSTCRYRHFVQNYLQRTLNSDLAPQFLDSFIYLANKKTLPNKTINTYTCSLSLWLVIIGVNK